MGLFSLGIQQQLQAVSAGFYSYPALAQIKQNSILVDEFGRESLNPTDHPEIYTLTSNDSNGTATITNGRSLVINTDSSAIGDDADVRTSGLTFERQSASQLMDNRTRVKLTITYSLGASTSIEGFIGFIETFAALSALPTTTRHAGLFWDRSANANIFLTSADGTTQTTTDTGEAIGTGIDRVEVTWTGGDNATIDYFMVSSGTSPDTTQTVTAMLMGGRAFQLHFFCSD